MKKSILFGVLAFFAVSAMSVQSVDAQNPVKKPTTEKKVEKKAEAAASTESKVVKKDDCCANKAGTTEKKTDDCCANKKADAGEKKFSVQTKERDAKRVSVEGKKVKKLDGKKPTRQRDEKARTAKAVETEK
ncbi:MAG: hypothetical protein IJ057_05145 [Bacteroidales bacterium]|nr:hypothetical protein [Bacteroidales bacterium]